MPSQSAVLLPIGRSPIHCLRLARCFSKNGVSLIILAVTEETAEFGKIIQEMESLSETEYIVSEYERARTVIESRSDDTEWNLVFGPGTRDMQVSMWHDVISVTGKPPKHWVDHRKRSSRGMGKNISVEQLVNLSSKTESYELGLVPENEALRFSRMPLSRYNEIIELTWVEHRTLFKLHISLPSNANEMTGKEARKWEESVYKLVNEVWNFFGRHAVHITRDQLPSSPAWWMNIGKRLRDFGIGGGSK